MRKLTAKICILMLLSGIIFHANAQNKLDENFLKKAITEAAQQQKKLYIFGTTPWCEACVVMQENVFNNRVINGVLAEQFVVQTLNLDSENGALIAMKYRAYPAPQHLVFNTDGQLTHRAKGQLDADEFLDFLNTASDSLPQLAKLPGALNFEMDYPEWYRNYRKSPSGHTVPTSDEVEAFLASRDSITDEVTWAILYTLPTPEKYIIQIAEQKEVLSRRFGKEEVLEKLSAYVYEDVKTAIKDHDSQKLHAALVKAENILGSDAAQFQFRYRLYYYQYHREWEAYALTALELSHHHAVATPDWLDDLAKTILSETKNKAILKTALRWMLPVVDKDKKYGYLTTAAQLEYALGNIENAEKLLKEALAAARNEDEEKKAKIWLLKIKNEG